MRKKTMIKRLLLVTLSLCVAWQTASAQSTTCSLDNVIIATDLDDVILQSNTTQRVLGALNPLNWFMTGAYALACAAHYKPDMKFSRACGEALYIAELRKNNGVETRATQFVRMMASLKQIMPDTLAVYQTLHKKGASFVTATNIGTIFFHDQQQNHPTIFNDQFIKEGLTVDYGATDVIEKPDIRYFENLKALIDPTGTKTIIFIDDKLDNIQGAQKAGLLAIQFKNAQQLKADLEQILGVSLTSC